MDSFDLGFTPEGEAAATSQRKKKKHKEFAERDQGMADQGSGTFSFAGWEGEDLKSKSADSARQSHIGGFEVQPSIAERGRHVTFGDEQLDTPGEARSRASRLDGGSLRQEVQTRTERSSWGQREGSNGFDSRFGEEGAFDWARSADSHAKATEDSSRSREQHPTVSEEWDLGQPDGFPRRFSFSLDDLPGRDERRVREGIGSDRPPPREQSQSSFYPAARLADAAAAMRSDRNAAAAIGGKQFPLGDIRRHWTESVNEARRNARPGSSSSFPSSGRAFNSTQAAEASPAAEPRSRHLDSLRGASQLPTYGASYPQQMPTLAPMTLPPSSLPPHGPLPGPCTLPLHSRPHHTLPAPLLSLAPPQLLPPHSLPPPSLIASSRSPQTPISFLDSAGQPMGPPMPGPSPNLAFPPQPFAAPSALPANEELRQQLLRTEGRAHMLRETLAKLETSLVTVVVPQLFEGKLGLTMQGTQVAAVADQRAASFGWMPGDVIQKVNGVLVQSTGDFTTELSRAIAAYNAERRPLVFEIQRLPAAATPCYVSEPLRVPPTVVPIHLPAPTTVLPAAPVSPRYLPYSQIAPSVIPVSPPGHLVDMALPPPWHESAGHLEGLPPTKLGPKPRRNILCL